MLDSKRFLFYRRQDGKNGSVEFIEVFKSWGEGHLRILRKNSFFSNEVIFFNSK